MAARHTIDDLINVLTPEIRAIFLEVIQNIVDDAIFADMVKAIEKGDVAGAFRALGFDSAAIHPLVKAIEDAFERGGNVTADDFPSPLKTPVGNIVFRFDMRNTRAEQYVRDHSAQLVTRLTEEARLNVQATIERGLAAGNNPRTTALDIVGRIDPVTKQRTGGIVGLAANQEQWVASARKKLVDLDKSYFTMTLRDKRYDSIVAKAIQDGKSLPSDTVDKLISSYKNKALKFRADSIARTETLQAIAASEWQAHKQAVDSGAINNNDIGKDWDSAGDNSVRHTHRELDKTYHTDEDAISLDDPFVSPSGALMMFPGDTSLGAGGDEIIGCRCRVRYVVDWIGAALRHG